MARGNAHIVHRRRGSGAHQGFLVEQRGEVPAQHRELSVGEGLRRGDRCIRHLEQFFGIEPRGFETGAKLGLRHGLELRGVAELLHEWLQRLGGRIDAFDFDSLELLRSARRRLDGGVVQIHLRQRKVRVRLEQFLALAPGIRLEQRRQRPFADELTDSFADARRGGEYCIHVRTAHAFGQLRAPRQAIVRDMQGLQGDLGLLIVCTRALATHSQGKASPKDHPVSRVVVRVGEFER